MKRKREEKEIKKSKRKYTRRESKEKAHTPLKTYLVPKELMFHPDFEFLRHLAKLETMKRVEERSQQSENGHKPESIIFTLDEDGNFSSHQQPGAEMIKLPNPNSQAAAERLKPLENVNPRVYHVKSDRELDDNERNEAVRDPFDNQEIFDLIRIINDPEHPYTLEQLHVVKLEDVKVDDSQNYVSVLFTPTIPHCSMATIIGLSIRVKLLRSIPPRFKVDVEIAKGTHASEDAVNKQLADKERVAAALENSHLLEVVNQCLLDNHENY